MGVEDVDRADALLRAVAEADVRADARLLEAPDRVQPAVRDVVRRLGVVVIHREVRVREDGEAGRVDVGLRRQAVGVRREIIRVVGVRLLRRRRAPSRASVMKRSSCALLAAVGDRRADRPRLHLLQADERRQRVEPGDRLGDSLHRGPGAREAARRVAEVADVVAEDAQRLHRGHRGGTIDPIGRRVRNEKRPGASGSRRALSAPSPPA